MGTGLQTPVKPALTICPTGVHKAFCIISILHYVQMFLQSWNLWFNYNAQSDFILVYIW